MAPGVASFLTLSGSYIFMRPILSKKPKRSEPYIKSPREANPGAKVHTVVQGKTFGAPMQSYGKYEPIFEEISQNSCTKYKLTCITVPSKVVGIHRYPV